VSGRFIINDLDAELDLLRRGPGTSQVPESMVIDDLREGLLRTAPDNHGGPMPVAHLHFPSGAQMAPRLRVFIDHFRSASEGDRDRGPRWPRDCGATAKKMDRASSMRRLKNLVPMP
jgi:DNA-binding transcriptional LysR family regulator